MKTKATQNTKMRATKNTKMKATKNTKITKVGGVARAGEVIRTTRWLEFNEKPGGRSGFPISVSSVAR